MSLRICLISLDYWPYRSSGLTIYAEDLARGLCERGHFVTVIAALRSGTTLCSQQNGIHVYRVPIDLTDWIGYSYRAAQLVKQLHQADPFDIVHFLDAHFAYAYKEPFVASLWQSFRQRLKADGGWPYSASCLNFATRLIYYNIARLYMESVSLKRADRLLVASESTAQEFIEQYGVTPTRLAKVTQGTDLTALKPVPCSTLRRKLGVDGQRIIFFLGFATARKGLEYLAQALHALPKDVVWIIGGRWEKGYRQKVFAKLGNLTNRVIEVGPIADCERAIYYSLADVYVSPSMLEGLGMTPIEAQACGTPAIVTDSSSGDEEVGNAGVVVPARDSEALAQAIIYLLDNPERRFELGRRARIRVLKRFTYQRMTEETLMAYEQHLQQSLPKEASSGGR